MGTPHLRPQVLQGAKLKLLYSAFGSSELLRDVTYALLPDETLEDHPALVVRKLVHQTKQAGVIFGRCEIGLNADVDWILESGNFPSGAFRLIGHGISGDSHQPGCEGSAAPFIVPKICQRFVENVGRQVLGRVAIVYVPGNKRIDPFKMNLIEIAKPGRISLRGFHQEPVLRV